MDRLSALLLLAFAGIVLSVYFWPGPALFIIGALLVLAGVFAILDVGGAGVPAVIAIPTVFAGLMFIAFGGIAGLLARIAAAAEALHSGPPSQSQSGASRPKSVLERGSINGPDGTSISYEKMSTGEIWARIAGHDRRFDSMKALQDHLLRGAP